jgi:hypothetical protein
MPKAQQQVFQHLPFLDEEASYVVLGSTQIPWDDRHGPQHPLAIPRDWRQFWTPGEWRIEPADIKCRKRALMEAADGNAEWFKDSGLSADWFLVFRLHNWLDGSFLTFDDSDVADVSIRTRRTLVRPTAKEIQESCGSGSFASVVHGIAFEVGHV